MRLNTEDQTIPLGQVERKWDHEGLFPFLERLEYVLLAAERMKGADASLVLENELQMMATLLLKCLKSLARTADGRVGGGGMRRLKRLAWVDVRSVGSRMEE